MNLRKEKTGNKGIIEKINENSVIINITENHSQQEFEGNRTEVAHKNYRILKIQ
ncbi:DUF2187 family protein [Metabacillus idriensis]|uniref:DUF2187 family protein n=1 Tax=Metabacillus idriensis TaxID=324768 RepID=UPI0031FC1677